MTTQITLPRDAEGREIPLDTTMLYGMDGEELDVRHFEFNPISGEWIIAALKNGPHNWIWTNVYRSPQNVYLEKQTLSDSWEKLLDDMERAIHTPDPGTYDSLMCGYFDSINTDCDECERKHHICRETCNDAAWVDITARIHKLMAGDGK